MKTNNVPAHASRSEQNGADNLAQVRDYYERTWLDYRLLWLNPQNRALHFGYWDANTKSHAESLLNMNQVLANRIGIQPGQRILDAGCGVGGTSIWLAKRYNAQVVGITPVADQIERARRYAREQGVDERVSFEQQDYTSTDFPDASFDIVVAMESVCHAPIKNRFLAEARRILRPGGRLGITEYMLTRPAGNAAERQLLNSWLSGWAIPNLATGEEWNAMPSESGFADAQLENITANVRPSLQRLYRFARLSWIFAVALRAMRVRSETQHDNTRAARDQYRALERGLWFEGMLTATA
ncbi:MAG: class I SAM-dependent methyltransferase [Chloroflexi bacterium]|nr:class I SAM-dependent methyltransferase [Chloroflexota bacterium]